MCEARRPNTGKRQMVRTRDQKGASDGLRRTKGGGRSSQVLCGPAWPIQAMIQQPMAHTTPELSRLCKARRSFRTHTSTRCWNFLRFWQIENVHFLKPQSRGKNSQSFARARSRELAAEIAVSILTSGRILPQSLTNCYFFGGVKPVTFLLSRFGLCIKCF